MSLPQLHWLNLRSLWLHYSCSRADPQCSRGLEKDPDVGGRGGKVCIENNKPVDREVLVRRTQPPSVLNVWCHVYYDCNQITSTSPGLQNISTIGIHCDPFPRSHRDALDIETYSAVYSNLP